MMILEAENALHHTYALDVMHTLMIVHTVAILENKLIMT
jgi:hypothetical protein